MSNRSVQRLDTGNRQDRDTVIGWIIIVGASLLALGFIGWLVWSFIHLIATAAPEIIAAVVITSGSVLVSALTYYYTRRLEQKRTRQQREHEQRAATYQELMNFWLQVLTEDEEEALNKRQRRERLNAFSPQLIAWGSDTFIESYLAFKGHVDLEKYKAYNVETTGPENAVALMDFEKLLNAMRSDLNADSKQLQSGTLLKMFLKVEDVEKIVQVSQQRQLPPPSTNLPDEPDSPAKEAKSHEHV